MAVVPFAVGFWQVTGASPKGHRIFLYLIDKIQSGRTGPVMIREQGQEKGFFRRTCHQYSRSVFWKTEAGMALIPVNVFTTPVWDLHQAGIHCPTHLAQGDLTCMSPYAMHIGNKRLLPDTEDILHLRR